MSNHHDTQPGDLVAYDLTQVVPPCLCCGGRDWYIDGTRNTMLNYDHLDHMNWGRPLNIVPVGDVTFTARCRTCGAVGSGATPFAARDHMVKETP